MGRLAIATSSARAARAALCLLFVSSAAFARQSDGPPPSIEVQSWAAPQPGWLYVLDSRPAPKQTDGAIWLINTASRSVVGKIATGPNPDFALSPDGSRLFVAFDRDDQQSDLVIIDTASGKILETANIDFRIVASGAPPYSSMFVSPDGATIRVLVTAPGAKLTDGFRLVSYDAVTGRPLDGVVHIGNCGYGRVIDYRAVDEFDYWCPATNRIRHLRVDSESRKLDETFVVLPWVRRLGVAQAFLLPANESLAIIRGDGGISTMDVNSASFSPTKVDAVVQGRILPAAWPTSPDGSRLYFGWCEFPNSRFYLDFDRSALDSPRVQTISELRVYDTSTWQKIKSIKTSKRFWSAVVTPDGKLLYAGCPESHNVLVVDTDAMRQTGAITVGGMPSLILVSP